MKRSTFISTALCALLAVSCAPNLDFAIPDDKIGFVDTKAYNEISAFDNNFCVTLIKSGKGRSNADVTIAAMTAEEVKAYNDSKVDTLHHLVCIDPSCYTISQTQFSFAEKDIRMMTTVSWDIEKLIQYLGTDAVIPIKISSCNIATDSTRTNLFIHPYVPTIRVSESSARKNFYVKDDVVKATDIQKGMCSVEIDKSLNSSDITVEMGVDNSKIPLGGLAAPEGLFTLENNTTTIKAGELFGAIDYRINYSALFKGGVLAYNDCTFTIPLSIVFYSPRHILQGETMTSFITVTIEKSKKGPGDIDRPTTNPKPITGPWTVLDGDQFTLGHDPVYIGQGWAQNNGADKFVDGKFDTYMSSWWDTPFSYPMYFVFDMGKDYIYDGFRFVNAAAYMNNFRHFRVYVSLEYNGDATEWFLASEGTYKETYTWQAWPSPANIETLAPFTYKMPEDNLSGATQSHTLTHGQYIKIEFVEPVSTSGNYLNGRGRIQEFYINGWER